MGRNISNIELQRLASKVMNGTATDEEFKLLNDWYSSFDDTRVLVDNKENLAEIQDRLRSKIRPEPSENREHRLVHFQFTKFAAVIALLLIAAATWFFVGWSKSVPLQENILTMKSKVTSWGQKRTIELPDGSIVKLNSGSSIEYPAKFDDTKRSVTLTGEAFFEVTRDEKRPFIVETSDVGVVVLGTSFNVKCYEKDQRIDVAVKTGKVKVTSNKTADYVTLLPDEAAVYKLSSSSIQKEKIVDQAAVFGWVDGHLILRDQDFQQVTETLARWYGVEFEVSKNFALSKRITAECDNSSLKEVLESLSHNYEFEYEIKGKVITIK